MEGALKRLIPLFILLSAVVGCPASLSAQEVVEASDVLSEPIPEEIVASAVAAVAKLGDEVVLGKYKVAIERMNPLWKERTAKRVGGMQKLESQLENVAREMVAQGISMISFKPVGKPVAHEIWPGKKMVGGTERLVYTQWMVLVPTATRFRIIREGDPKPIVLESVSYQVAVSDKAKIDWTFIDGSSLNLGDLRSMYLTLPKDMELPPVHKREVR
jgi:hypothetical protein